MKLWSLQPHSVAESIKRRGFAIAQPDFKLHWGQTSESWGFKQAYQWMSEQMIRRIGPAPDGVTFPIWAWVRPPFATSRGAPDLRHMRDAEAGVLLELEVDPIDSLLSDHGSWHFVLNGYPMSLSEAHDDHLRAQLRSLCTRLGLPLSSKGGRLNEKHFEQPEILDFLSLTWDGIFNLEPIIEGHPARMALGPLADPEWIEIGEASVQACLWRIEKRQVISSTPFSGRKPSFKHSQ